jgi:hypothetical protein
MGYPDSRHCNKTEVRSIIRSKDFGEGELLYPLRDWGEGEIIDYLRSLLTLI